MSPPLALARLHEAVALAHTIPGVSLELRMTTGRDRLLVSDRCLGAHLTPCQLRAALLAVDRDPTSTCFATLVERVELRGVHHIGGGLHQCTSTDGRDERWFTTSLHPDHIVELIERCSVTDDDELGVLIKHDSALGVSVVCVMSTSAGAALDELAVALLASALAEELLTTAR